MVRNLQVSFNLFILLHYVVFEKNKDDLIVVGNEAGYQMSL